MKVRRQSVRLVKRPARRKAPVRPPRRSFLFLLLGLIRPRHCMPCVGLVVLVGAFTVVVTPDDPADLMPPSPKPGGLPTIVIDPGHGGRDEGARGNRMREKDYTLDLAWRVERKLKTLNFPTLLTRRNDQYLSLSERVSIANREPDSIFVSLHFNAARQSGIAGVETFYANVKEPPEEGWKFMGLFAREEPEELDTGETLAAYIQTALVSKLTAENRGIKSRDLYVIRHTRAPAVLIEAGFISNGIEATLLKNADYRDRIAAAIAEGVALYQKTRTLPEATPAPEPLP